MRTLAKFIFLLVVIGCLWLAFRDWHGRRTPPHHKVLCAGDSTTLGFHLASADDSYPSALGRLLGEDYLVMNGGVTGCTVLKTGDWPYWNQGVFVEGANFYPEIVVLMLGTNDAKHRNWVHRQDFEADAKALLEHYVNLPSNPKVYLCLPCPVFAPLPLVEQAELKGQYIDGKILDNEIIPIWLKVAARAKIPVINIHHLLQGRESDFPDGIHPNAAINSDIAKAVYERIFLEK